MTPKQRKILDFIAETIDQKGFTPSFQEIGDHMGLRSLATVSKHIDSLIAQGKIIKKAGGVRSIQLTDGIPESRFRFVGEGKNRLFDTLTKSYWVREK